MKVFRTEGFAKERPKPSQTRVQAVRPNLVEVLDMMLLSAINDHDVAANEIISGGGICDELNRADENGQTADCRWGFESLDQDQGTVVAW